MSCTDLLTNYWSLQVLDDDEISGSCLQSPVLYTCLHKEQSKENEKNRTQTHNGLLCMTQWLIVTLSEAQCSEMHQYDIQH